MLKGDNAVYSNRLFSLQPFLYATFTFFLLADPFGNAPPILALIHPYPPQKQRQIIIRECLAALALALLFLFGGEAFLRQLSIREYTVDYAGGLILLLVALPMIFGQTHDIHKETPRQEPFLVPIATPLIAGPTLLTILILFLHQEGMTPWLLSLALITAWIPLMILLLLSPLLLRLLGKSGMSILEQLMGMFLALLAVDLIIKASTTFVHSLR